MNTQRRARDVGSPQNRYLVQRKHPRINTKGMSADIADGKLFASGFVENISAGGFRLTQISQTFSANQLSYTAVIGWKNKTYKLQVKPCWKQIDNVTCTVGFKIIEGSWEWVEFANKALQIAKRRAVTANA